MTPVPTPCDTTELLTDMLWQWLPSAMLAGTTRRLAVRVTRGSIWVGRAPTPMPHGAAMAAIMQAAGDPDAWVVAHPDGTVCVTAPRAMPRLC